MLHVINNAKSKALTFELKEKISQEVNDDLKLIVTSTLDVAQRKVVVIKKLEDETFDIFENEEQLEQIVIESTDYENIHKTKNIAQFWEFLNKIFHQHRAKGKK